MNENKTPVEEKKKLTDAQDEKGRFVKGNPGKQKGVTHKFTDLKKAFFAVFEKIEKEAELKDGIDSFYEWATKTSKNQGLFYQMLSKMLPTNVNFEGDLPITFELSERFMPKKEEPDVKK